MSADRPRDALDAEYEVLLDEARAQLGLPPREPPPVAEPVPSITCPTCGRTSYHPVDVSEGYCGACHDWTSPPGDERARAAGRPERRGPVGDIPRPAPPGSPPAAGRGAGGGLEREPPFDPWPLGGKGCRRRAAALLLVLAGGVAGCVALWHTVAGPAAALVIGWTAVVLALLVPLRRLLRRGRR